MKCWVISETQFKCPDSWSSFFFIVRIQSTIIRNTEEGSKNIRDSSYVRQIMTILLMVMVSTRVKCRMSILLLPALCQQIAKYVEAWIWVWIQSVTYFGPGGRHGATVALCSIFWVWVSRNCLFHMHQELSSFRTFRVQVISHLLLSSVSKFYTLY